MTNYKSVPVEPTKDMLEAGHYAMVDGCCPSGVYADMLAAAPAVQGEPVGWYTEDHLDDKSATTYSAEVAQRWRDKGWPVWPLYTAPQPALDVTATPDLLEASVMAIEHYDAYFKGAEPPEDLPWVPVMRAAIAAYHKGDRP